MVLNGPQTRTHPSSPFSWNTHFQDTRFWPMVAQDQCLAIAGKLGAEEERRPISKGTFEMGRFLEPSRFCMGSNSGGGGEVRCRRSSARFTTITTPCPPCPLVQDAGKSYDPKFVGRSLSRGWDRGKEPRPRSPDALKHSKENLDARNTSGW
jgi:hypothetical protein